MKYFSYNGEQYTNHRNSINPHWQTKLGDIENKILAVGAVGDMDKYYKVELFDISSNRWSTQTSFPFCSSE